MLAKRRPLAFTLIELLVVIAIIAVLAAILFPVFAKARGKAREAACSSNLKQIGLSIRMYTQDYDELYPFVVDPSDKFAPQIWNAYPAFQSMIPNMPMLQDALQPYIKSLNLFSCPSDIGFQMVEFNGVPLDASPSSFQKFGTSYLYRTEISFNHAGEGTFHTPSELNVLLDASGLWHGSAEARRYNVLFADGHVKSQTYDQLQVLWNKPL